MPAGQAGPALSPYQVVLGPAIDDLAPSLRRYFGAIPAGSVGVGRGVFDRVGTPRRWLWPILAVVGRGGAMFPVWEHDVPFDVVNRPVVADGRPGVAAVRTFHLRSGSRDMVDLVTAVPVDGRPRLLDLLGRGRTLLVLLEATPAGDGLQLTSSSSALRLGPLRVRMPRFIRPRLDLRERRGGDGRQHLSLTIDLPPFGRIYEYAGAFDYEIVQGGDRHGGGV